MDLERYYELRTILQQWKKNLAENLRRKIESSPRLLRRLQTLYEKDGASEEFTNWLDRWCRQAAIGWILRTLFLRVLEDRELLGVVRIRTTDGQMMWGQLTRSLGAAAYLQWCCRDAAHLLPDLFGPTEYDLLLPDDELIQRFFDEVWRRQDPNRSGWLRFDFRGQPAGDSEADGGFQTRFIGELYQDLDSEIRERFALLQTPHFVAQFILENTLLKRFEEKDFRAVTLIDPTCGSGHFLVDAFWLFVAAYEKLARQQIQRGPETILERAKIARHIIEDNLFGCDINPYATALTRFRLTLAACDYAKTTTLRDLRKLKFNVVTIDSLIPYEKLVKNGGWEGQQVARVLGRPDDIRRALPVLKRRYDVVVGNPPYIFPSETHKRELYREHYSSAYSKFGLSAPFTERFFHLAMIGGLVGLINSNAFARRQFGAKLIEEILPRYDLRAVIDLSGAYIPGHGTPTLILFVRNDSPLDEDVTVISVIKGEPGTPTDPSKAKVWQSVINGFDNGPGFLNEYVDVAVQKRGMLSRHPWQFGGGKNRLYTSINNRNEKLLQSITSAIGFDAITGADELFIQSSDTARRLSLNPHYLRSFVQGETVRDWIITTNNFTVFPYESNLEPFCLEDNKDEAVYLSKYKEYLANRMQFGKTAVEAGLRWFEFRSFYKVKRRTSLFIVFPEITSHPCFVVTDDNFVFAQTAPVIKLIINVPSNYWVIASVLNSSLVAFCLKQTCFNKGSGSDPVRDRYVYSGSCVEEVFLPSGLSLGETGYQMVEIISREIEKCTGEVSKFVMQGIFMKSDEAHNEWNRGLSTFNPTFPLQFDPFKKISDIRQIYEKITRQRSSLRSRLIFLQEELDWLAYELYGLIKKAPMAEDFLSPTEYQNAGLELGQRPFEIAGKGYTGDWPEGYQLAPLPEALKALTEARIAIIESSPDIAILEDPLYKRRWIPPDYQAEFREAANWWLAEKLEWALEQHGRPVSLREWARLLAGDERVNATLEVLTGTPAFDLEAELMKVIAANSVANRPEHYLKISGLRKFVSARQGEDGSVPEYESKDFSAPSAWRIRGKLNIPRERFISYREFTHVSRGAGRNGGELPESGGPWFGWAGWDAAQRAEALAYLLDKANRAGWALRWQQCGLRAALRDLLPQLTDLSEADRTEFEAIAGYCGIPLASACYCQAYREAAERGEPGAPGVGAEELGVKALAVEPAGKGRSRKKGQANEQLSLDI